jgi:hypothetical protein
VPRRAGAVNPTVAKPILDRSEAEVTFYPVLHLKPLCQGAALK